MTAERAKAIGANEMGLIPVFMYHLIEPEESEWSRTPENFRRDLALLEKEGFWPITVRDLASGNIDIPAGKSPVVLTFDDSSMGQYHILEDGSLDPDCAVGIMQAEVEAKRWAPRASFFPLIDVDVSSREIFGQPDLKREKLRNLVAWGYEVGSHTVTHLNLAKASRQEAAKQLAQSQQILEDLIGGGYSVTSLAVPFGEYPASDQILSQGKYQDITYAYSAVLSTVGELCTSPFSGKFQPLHIPRIRGSTKYITAALDTLKKNPGLRYISDGDPTTVSAPLDLDPALGEMRSDLGRPVVRY
ncbi:MAG: polysaccharide deacetylase family protein [Thermoleophilia bacterium]|nr:polysaccharide deacetylase family protein [Thermoleophilia bacterium]